MFILCYIVITVKKGMVYMYKNNNVLYVDNRRLTVGDLKKFICNIDDNLPIQLEITEDTIIKDVFVEKRNDKLIFY